jgi:hypothetical protein
MRSIVGMAIINMRLKYVMVLLLLRWPPVSILMMFLYLLRIMHSYTTLLQSYYLLKSIVLITISMLLDNNLSLYLVLCFLFIIHLIPFLLSLKCSIKLLSKLKDPLKILIFSSILNQGQISWTLLILKFKFSQN